MALSSLPAAASGFAAYLHSQVLPARHAETRRVGDCQLTLVEHAPCRGIEYAPVDALIVSVVLKARQQPVVRQLPSHELRFLDSVGQVVLTPPDNPSWWRFESAPQVLHLSIPNNTVGALLHLPPSLVTRQLQQAARQVHDDPLVSHLATRLWLTAPHTTSHTRRHAQAGLVTLLATLLDNANKPEPLATSTQGLAPWRIQKALDWMDRARPEATVAELAAHLGLSPDHFSRAFKAATGQSPHQRMSQRRLDQAKHWLQTTSRPLTELAAELGYASSAHFSTRFRQLVGESPSQWRARHRTDVQD